MSGAIWKRPRAYVIAALSGGAITAGAMAIDMSPPLLMINETPSLPKGIYLRRASRDLRPGSIVAITQPSAARPYLASLGVPAEMWILKRVAAVGGDPVCAKHGRLSTPSRSAQVLQRDRRARPLPEWKACRYLAPGELFLLGETPTSFDSRYFGPVSEGQVAGVYRQVLRWQ